MCPFIKLIILALILHLKVPFQFLHFKFLYHPHHLIMDQYNCQTHHIIHLPFNFGFFLIFFSNIFILLNY